MGDPLNRRVDEFLRLSQIDPVAALKEADRLLGVPSDGGTECSRAEILWVKGHALRELDRPHESAAMFQAAASEAERTKDRTLAGRAQVSLSLTLAHLGKFSEALELIDSAARTLSGSEQTEALAQRALILQRAGRFDQALPEWDRVTKTFHDSGDLLSEGKALVNRGTVFVYLGCRVQALSDLTAAEHHFRAAGAPIRAAEAVHDQGFAASRFGDLPTALRLFDQAQREMGALGIAADPATHLDRIETLVRAGLAHEAAAISRAVADQVEKAGLQSDLAEVSLLAALANYRLGDRKTSRGWATRAEHLFAEQGRTRWHCLAQLAVLRASPPADLAEASKALGEVADRLIASGWLGAGVEALLLQLQSYKSLSAVEARAIADTAAAIGRDLPAEWRGQVWLIEAIARRAEGRSPAALRALRAGADLLESHHGSLGATDLRAGAKASMEPLAELGASMSLDAGRIERAFAWFERSRARTLHAPAVVPHDDAEIAGALERLRTAGARLEHDELTLADAVTVRRQIIALEELIRRRLRHQTSPAGPTSSSVVKVSTLSELLGPRVLVEYGVVDGDIVGLVLENGQWHSARLCTLPDASKVVDDLAHALLGYVSDGTRHKRNAAHIQQLGILADDLLLSKLGIPVDRDLVIIPAGPLHGLAWAAIPSMVSRPFALCPSASLWALASRRATLPESPAVFVAAGPGLVHANREAALVAAAHSDAELAVNERATARAVLDATDRSDIIHIASHGSFRADNPLFSALRLADGPLSGYELSRRSRHPHLYVLSACDTAITAPRSSGAIGMAATLLTPGAAAVGASVPRADDAQTPSLMAAFHRRLRQGLRADLALAEARSDQEDHLMFAGFSLYGAAVSLAPAS